MTLDKNMKVLIADDIQTVRAMLRGILKRLGFPNISEASDGIDALARLKQEKYGMLLTDVNMPNMDGITLVRMLRADSELKDMLVLMITSESDKKHVLDAMKAGINDYIVKPFTANILQEKIEQALTKIQQARKTT